jgi:hypothetical protein
MNIKQKSKFLLLFLLVKKNLYVSNYLVDNGNDQKKNLVKFVIEKKLNISEITNLFYISELYEKKSITLEEKVVIEEIIRSGKINKEKLTYDYFIGKRSLDDNTKLANLEEILVKPEKMYEHYMDEEFFALLQDKKEFKNKLLTVKNKLLTVKNTLDKEIKKINLPLDADKKKYSKNFIDLFETLEKDFNPDFFKYIFYPDFFKYIEKLDEEKIQDILKYIQDISKHIQKTLDSFEKFWTKINKDDSIITEKYKLIENQENSSINNNKKNKQDIENFRFLSQFAKENGFSIENTRNNIEKAKASYIEKFINKGNSVEAKEEMKTILLVYSATNNKDLFKYEKNSNEKTKKDLYEFIIDNKEQNKQIDNSEKKSLEKNNISNIFVIFIVIVCIFVIPILILISMKNKQNSDQILPNQITMPPSQIEIPLN